VGGLTYQQRESLAGTGTAAAPHPRFTALEDSEAPLETFFDPTGAAQSKPVATVNFPYARSTENSFHPDAGGNIMSATSTTQNKQIKFLALGFLSLIFAWGCGGGGGSDKSEEACEDLINAFDECFVNEPLTNDEFDDLLDICDQSIIQVAEEAGGDECVDAFIDALDCIGGLECETILMFIENPEEFDLEDLAECEVELLAIAGPCNGEEPPMPALAEMLSSAR
jgi:hypothetical protein